MCSKRAALSRDGRCLTNYSFYPAYNVYYFSDASRDGIADLFAVSYKRVAASIRSEFDMPRLPYFAAEMCVFYKGTAVILSLKISVKFFFRYSVILPRMSVMLQRAPCGGSHLVGSGM